MSWERTFEQTRHPQLGSAIACSGLTASIGLVSLAVKPLSGTLILALSATVPALFWYMGTTLTVCCTSAGFSVASSSRRAGSTCSDYTWEEVSATRYRESVSRANNSLRKTGYFSVYTVRGRAFEVSDQMQSFAELVALFNRMAVHLPYVWQRNNSFVVPLDPAHAQNDRYQQVSRRPVAAVDSR